LKGTPWKERGARDLGEWGLMVRTVAGWDSDRTDRVLLWPLRDLLLAYVAFTKREALERYELQLLVWASLAPHQKNATRPPKAPRILED